MLIVTLCMIPLLLFPKPIILYLRNSSSSSAKKSEAINDEINE